MSYELRGDYNAAVSHFPNHGPRPLIGLTGNFGDKGCELAEAYSSSIEAAGGIPVVIPASANATMLLSLLDRLDGIVLTGGADINPLFTGEEPVPALGNINAHRDRGELLLTQLAFDRQIPMLGICRGMQTLAMALGGHVKQDVSSDIKHSQDADRGEATHRVSIEEDSTLAYIYKQATTLCVNSFHHQAVDDAGLRFRITAKAPDGVAEAMESTEHKPIMGVQWHPEWLGGDGLLLFRWLVDQAQNFRAAKQLHQRILTLDTHCDTPMFFPQGIHFEQRDKRILVDLHKMTDGHQDAVIMAAYLPQPKLGDTFSATLQQSSSFEGVRDKAFATTPYSYANGIFDQIEAIVGQNSRYLSLARTPADLYADKQQGRKSIMFAIENGLALEHDLSNVKRFAQRGVVYITLCHNGDNDICDSARGCNTHDGVSQFGEQVIRQMNACGIMVDLSHAGEKSFYDALQISDTPIVCSHSNCRALCDHPRNLTDDQLRALAARGGVAHTTLYGGFLRKQGEASILDAISHLEHAIEVMGIDHVGLGTDFDGDGGVRGIADSSELINFTLHLLRRKYSERDIRKIWGGNWLRVMTEVQGKKA